RRYHALRPASGRSGFRGVRARKGPRHPRGARGRPRRDRSGTAAARRRHVRRRRGHGRADRSGKARGLPDRTHQRSADDFVIVRFVLSAGAREAAGCNRDEFEVDEAARLDVLLTRAVERYGEGFASVLGTSRVWINGDEPAEELATVLAPDDEVAVLPPVSGG